MAVNERRGRPRRRADRAVHDWRRRVAVAYLILLAAAIVGLAKLQLNADGTAGALKANTVAGCQRLNILEVKENVSHYADWRVFKVVVKETLAAPSPPTRAGRQDLAEFIGPLEAAVRAKAWTPILNCNLAVKRHGGRYVLPLPVPFNRQLPPRSALEIP